MQGLPKLQNALLSEVKLGLGYNSMVEACFNHKLKVKSLGLILSITKNLKKKKMTGNLKRLISRKYLH